MLCTCTPLSTLDMYFLPATQVKQMHLLSTKCFDISSEEEIPKHEVFDGVTHKNRDYCS